MKTLLHFFESKIEIGSTLFYPGAGYDFETLKFFIENSKLSTFYFVDYETKPDNTLIEDKLGSNWEITSQCEMFPSDFNQNDWSNFWHPIKESKTFSDSSNAFGVKYFLKSQFGQKVELICLGTEAFQTYNILLNCGIIPDVIVIQDHGFGGNWNNNTFGYYEDYSRNSLLYSISKSSLALPKLLFVGENTGPWPDFIQVSNFEGAFGSAGHSRAIFSRV
jgi:hypothetical protein